MTNIKVFTNDQVLSATVLPKVACNNQNSVRLSVTFDGAWDGYATSAVFYTSKDPTTYEVILTDGNCLVPAEVLAEEAILYIGVKGVKIASGEVKTSALLRYKVLAGTPTMVISDPTPSVYQQFLSISANLERQIAVEHERISNISSLKEGSTTGDAELADIHIGGDYETYPNAGDAVRGQYLDAKGTIEAIANVDAANLFDPTKCVDGSMIVSGTGAFEDNTEYWRTKKLPLCGAVYLACNIGFYKIVFYDSNGDVLANQQVTGDTYIRVYKVPNASYFAMQFNATSTPFDSRFDIAIYAFDSAGEAPKDFKRKYMVEPSAIEGPLPILADCIRTDEANLFDPLMCINNRAITNNGLCFRASGNWVTDYIDISSYGYLSVNSLIYKTVFYDSNNEVVYVVESKDGHQKTDVPSGAKYARIQFAESTVSFAERNKIILCGDSNISDGRPKYTIDSTYIPDFEILKGIVKKDENNLFDPTKSFDGFAFATANGSLFPSATYWVTDYIPVNGLTNVSCNYPIYKYGWYDADKNVLAVNQNAPDEAAYLLLQFENSVIPYSDRFNVVVCNEAADISSVKPFYYVTNKSDDALGHIGEFKTTLQLTGTSYMSDHTFIGEKLYAINASSDDHAEYAKVTIYTVDLESGNATYDGFINHNLGHANSIDYCAANDCLILGNGSSDSSLAGEIYILPSVSTRETWEYNDCIKIDLSDEDWGIKTNVVWGEHNNGAYNIAYVITNNNANVRKILLTKTGGAFDGGYIVIEEWSAAPVDVNQGTVYHDGKLYIGIGHSGLWMLECTLMGGGKISIKQHKDVFYDENGSVLVTPFTEGITIKDNHVLIGGSNGKIYVYKM